MPTRVTLAPVVVVGPFPTSLPVSANALDVAQTAADPTNKDQFVFTGKEIILAHNTDTAPHNVTLSSQADPSTHRKGDIAAYALAAATLMAFDPAGAGNSGAKGWQQSDGKFYLEADDATVKFSILKINR